MIVELIPYSFSTKKTQVIKYLYVIEQGFEILF